MIIKSPIDPIEIPEVPVQSVMMQTMSMYVERTAMIDAVSGTEYTYQQVLDIIPRLTSALCRLGVRKGDVLSICSHNKPEFVLIYIAALSAGATISTINPVYTTDEMLFQLNDSNTVWVYADESVLPRIKETTTKYRNLKGIITNSEDSECVSITKLMNDNGDCQPDFTVDPKEDVALILYSSGTTGLPKGVMLTHYNIVANLLQMSHEAFGPRSESIDTVLVVIPYFHAYGMVALLHRCLMGGTRVITIRNFHPEKFLEAIEKYKVTVLPLVPPLVTFLLKSPLVAKYDLSSLRVGGSGAAPLKSEMEVLFKKQFHLEEMRQGYGMTETTCVATRPYPEHKPGVVGYLIPNCEAKLVDPETGKMIDPHIEGELCIRGPNIMKGYLNKPDVTRQIIDEDGFLHTGDVAYFDKDGVLYIVDRIKELVKYKGFQVAPAELENLLLGHSEVADAAVVGVEDADAGELPKAFVVKKVGSDVTARDLVEYVEKKVAPFKRLRGGVEFLAEIPKTQTGKILRRVLRNKSRKSRI